MQLSDLFRPNCIKIGLEAEDKDEVFEELVDLLIRCSDIEDRDSVLEAIHERESKMSTGIKAGIAIPHGRNAAVPGLRGVVGISRKGIDYDALDGKPVYLVFLMVGAPTSSEPHLKALQKVAILLDDPQFYAEMTAVSGPEEAHAVIKKFEEITGYQD